MANIEDTHKKLEALFLNRVKDLEWYYFELDLNKHGNNHPTQSFKYKEKLEESDLFQTFIVADANGDYVFKPNSNTLHKPGKHIKVNNQDAILRELLAYMRVHANAPREIIKRIFDANEPKVLLGGNAEEGALGKANRRSHRIRHKKFYKKIRSKRFQQGQNFIILAEGDSWFHFPRVRVIGDPLRDIVDNLMQNRRYAVKSMAAGGDWLSNMIKTSNYIQELDRISPDVFLFSGGGNDMVGNYRLGKMIRREGQNSKRTIDSKIEKLVTLRKNSDHAHSFDEIKYRKGLSYLTDDFFNFINVTMSQYFLLLSEIFTLPKYQNLKFITHGYDFPIPMKKRRGFLISKQRLLNEFLNTGKWLYDPMMMKKILDKDAQKAILYTMIYEFNEMLIKLATYDHFKNLYHIDCRGLTQGEDDWFDEIHLTRRNFRTVANVYEACIEGRGQGKVYRVTDYL